MSFLWNSVNWNITYNTALYAGPTIITSIKRDFGLQPKIDLKMYCKNRTKIQQVENIYTSIFCLHPLF